jgi:5-methyltetrahydrofolate--homocysteine methyltransferase
MFQSDLSYMLSPKMFEKFVLPDLLSCFAQVDHAFYHLDGKGQIRHLDLLLSLEELEGIQWIPGAGEKPPEEWLPLLKRVRDSGKLCQVYVTAEGARKIVREIGGRGFAFYVIPFPTMSEDQARDYLRALSEEDLSRS